MDVSGNSGTPKSSILIGFSIINHPFWGTSIFGNIHIFISGVEWNGMPFKEPNWPLLPSSNCSTVQ